MSTKFTAVKRNVANALVLHEKMRIAAVKHKVVAKTIKSNKDIDAEIIEKYKNNTLFD
ncbi:hypothetical protein FDI40_gp151 [Agrobacterium phage Atu_ph07]|uniref:Uncharacterized protein n=1 Tax=Agrobacterium phage Atu_ph07 TaxID=2024264 RepID=A0A2L0UZH8_9CAUD|nr:hypothetical protein FDI40_gp151 [Agrobacterium phage Atu_ph07]AUZ94933.1 hypothetical protein [Agrobacterium phage Atu_ph07]